jgi:hypothetical protein
MRSYGKIQTSFWGWATRKKLSHGARELAMYLLTNPHANGTGCFYLPDGYIVADLGINGSPNGSDNGSANPFETVSERFAELAAVGFALRCHDTQWVLVPKMLEYDPPANPNVWKSLLKDIGSIPDDFAYLSEFIEVLKPHANGLPNGYINGLGNPPTNGMRNPDLTCPDLSCPVGAGKKSKDYAFEGKVIRIDHSQADAWRRNFPKVDLIPELTAADAYYVENPPKDGKWFFAVSNWLKRSNERAIEKQSPHKQSAPGKMDRAAVDALMGEQG